MKNVMTSLGLIFSGLLMVIIALFGTAFILAFPIKWLWNWVMVDVFYFESITYWHAFGIYLLSGLLFTPMRSSGSSSKD